MVKKKRREARVKASVGMRSDQTTGTLRSPYPSPHPLPQWAGGHDKCRLLTSRSTERPTAAVGRGHDKYRLLIGRCALRPQNSFFSSSPSLSHPLSSVVPNDGDAALPVPLAEDTPPAKRPSAPASPRRFSAAGILAFSPRFDSTLLKY